MRDELTDLLSGDPVGERALEVPGNWSLRQSAVNAATVMRLRSRFESPGRSQTSPYTTVSVSSMSFGATGPNLVTRR